MSEFYAGRFLRVGLAAGLLAGIALMHMQARGGDFSGHGFPAAAGIAAAPPPGIALRSCTIAPRGTALRSCTIAPPGTAPVIGLTSFDGTTAGALYFNNQPSGTTQANILSSGLDFSVIAAPSGGTVTLSLTSGAGYGTATSTNNRFIRAIRGATGSNQVQSMTISSDNGSAFDLFSIAVQCSTIPAGDNATIALTAYRLGVQVGTPVTVSSVGSSPWNLLATPGFQGIDELIVSAADNNGGLIGAIGADAVSIYAKPAVTTSAATAVTGTGATLNGTVNDNYAATTTAFIYGTDPNLATGTTTVTASPSPVTQGSGNTAVTYPLTGLQPNTTYYFEAQGTNPAGAVTGAILSFTTPLEITVSPASAGTAQVGVPYGPLTFTANGGTAPYSFALSGGTLPPGLTLSASGQLSGTPTAGGTYNFSITATDANGFVSAMDNLTLPVNPPVFVFGPSNLTGGLYGTAYSAALTVSGGTPPYGQFIVATGSLPPGITLSSTGVLTGVPTAAGTYTFTVDATDASSGTPYTQESSLYTLVIGQAALTITADNQQMTYGGTVPALTITYSGFVNGDNIASLTVGATASTAATSASPAGGYQITASGAVDNNYLITYVSGTLTIGQAALTITADNQQMTYGGTVPALTVTYSGFVNGDNVASLAVGPMVSTAATSASPVGGYPITVSGAVDNNYLITYVSGTLTIGRAALTITADNQQMTYGGVVPALTVTYSGFVNGDGPGSLTTAATASTTATSASPAGGYPITASGAVDNNYLITYASGTLTIGQAALTITADNQQMTYGSAVPALTVTYSGFVNGDNVASLTTAAAASTTATSASPAGDYPITVGGAADNNYVITYVSGTLTIGRAALTITADNQQMTYGGTVPALAVTYSGFVNGDNVASLTTAATASTTATSASPVGGYPITVSGAVDNNYLITYASGTLTIGQAALTITADNQQMTYGGAVPALTVTYSGFVNGDNVASLTTAATASTTATSASPVAVYPITVNGAADDNYVITYAAGALTVAPATLLVTAADQTRYVGEANPTLTISYSGFVNGQTTSVLTSIPVASTAATAGSPAGAYPITVSGGAAPNYILTYQSGTLTILQTLPNVITFGALPVKTYGDPDFVISATASSNLPVTFTSQDNSVATVTQNAAGNWVVHIVSAGQVTISADQAGDGTYSAATTTDQVLLVNKADQAILFPVPQLPTVVTGETITLEAASSSGLPVTYRLSDPGLAALSGNTLILSGAGTEIVTASQAGNADFNAAAPVSDTIQIYNGNGFRNGIGVFPNPAHGTLHVHMSEGYLITKLVIFNLRGEIVQGMDAYVTGPDDIPLNVSGLRPGIYLLRVVAIRNNEVVYPVFKIEIQ